MSVILMQIPIFETDLPTYTTLRYPYLYHLPSTLPHTPPLPKNHISNFHPHYRSHVIRKPVYTIYNQQRRKSARCIQSPGWTGSDPITRSDLIFLLLLQVFFLCLSRFPFFICFMSFHISRFDIITQCITGPHSQHHVRDGSLDPSHGPGAVCTITGSDPITRSEKIGPHFSIISLFYFPFLP